jgi:hypothetical protein
MKTLQKFASIHANVHNHFSLERHLVDRQTYRKRRSAALAEWQVLARCLIPRFDGAILSLEWKEAVWDKFVMGAPRRRTRSEQQYSDRKLRSRR